MIDAEQRSNEKITMSQIARVKKIARPGISWVAILGVSLYVVAALPLAYGGGLQVSVSPTSQTIARGSSATYTATVTCNNCDFVRLSVSISPACICALYGGTTFTVYTGSTTPLGTYTITATATAVTSCVYNHCNSESKSTTATLTVN